MGKKRKRAGNGGAQHDYAAEAYDVYFEQPPIEGAHRYNFSEDLEWDCQKYWHQRFDLFSKYNQGVWMTADSWFEVTPEPIARRIADHTKAAIPDGRSIIIDIFCGVGGNAIAFALSGRYRRVYAIEKNPAALACARRNAEIYGVADQISWFEGDCFEVLGLDPTKKENAVSELNAIIGTYGVVFASPPWGGPGYKSSEVFNLDEMQPYSLKDIYGKVSQMTKNMILYLPRTSDLRQIASCVDAGQKAQIVHYCTYNNSRALCAYLGDWKPLPIDA